jgi:hypothetical protein
MPCPTLVTRPRGAAILLGLLIAVPFYLALAPSLHVVSASASSLRHEALTLPGADLAGFLGSPVEDLHAVVYRAGPGDPSGWVEVPVQVDERNDANGSLFFDAGDGLLDANDEIVLMASDLGEQAPAGEWFIQGGPTRYEVSVYDPVAGVTGWAYLHAYAGPQPEDYVTFTPANVTVDTPAYTLGFNDIMVSVLEEVRIHEGADGRDILDRSKFRAFLYRFGIPISLDEEDLEYELLGYLDGPVRAAALTNTTYILGDGTHTLTTMFFYRGYFNQTAEVHLQHQTSWIRYSNDFSSSAGVMTYEDSLGNAATVDGVSETLSGPPPDWVQVSGPGGTVVTLGNASGMGGSQSLYYRDDLTSLEDDSVAAENGEYGDAGVRFDNPPLQTSIITGRVHLLPAGVGQVAPEYAAWDSSPLIVAAQLQQEDVVVDVTHPAGGETFVGGHTVPVWWNMTATAPNSQLVVDIRYSTDGGATFPFLVVDGLPGTANPGTHDWVVPFINADGVVLRVTALDPESGSTASDITPPFAVEVRPPTIESVTVSPVEPQVPGPVTISAVVTAEAPIDQAWVNLSGGPSGNFTMVHPPGATYILTLDYDAPAAVNFTVWVSDALGVWSSATGGFDVVDEEPPVAVATARPREVVVGDTVTLDGRSSTDNHRVAAYRWSLEDDGLRTFEGAVVNYTFQLRGTYNVTLRVEDPSGNVGTDTVTVLVKGEATGPGVPEETVPLTEICLMSLVLFGFLVLGLWLVIRRRVLKEGAGPLP